MTSVREMVSAVPAALTEPVSIGDVVELVDAVTDDIAHIAQRDLPTLDRDELAAVALQLSTIVAALATVTDDTLRHLAALVEYDVEVCGDVRVERRTPTRTEWSANRARSAISEKIVEHTCTDPLTGEIHPPLRRAVTGALDLAFAAVSSAPKASMNATGLRSLGLEPDDYRTIHDLPARLKVTPR